MIRLYFHDYSQKGEACIFTFDANEIVFVYDNKLIHAQHLYDIIQKKQKKKLKVKPKQYLKNGQSTIQILQLLELPELKNCLMIMITAEKQNGVFGNWWLKNKHSILFFPQFKGRKLRNPGAVYKYSTINWKNQNISTTTVTNARKMECHKRMGTLENLPPSILINDVSIVKFTSIFKINDCNGHELLYGYHDNQVEDVNGNIRSLDESDEISYNVKCTLLDESSNDISNTLTATAFGDGAYSLFGKDARTAYFTHCSTAWYEDRCRDVLFDLVLQSWSFKKNNQTFAGWRIAHRMDARNKTKKQENIGCLHEYDSEEVDETKSEKMASEDELEEDDSEEMASENEVMQHNFDDVQTMNVDEKVSHKQDEDDGSNQTCEEDDYNFFFSDEAEVQYQPEQQSVYNVPPDVDSDYHPDTDGEEDGETYYMRKRCEIGQRRKSYIKKLRHKW